MKVEDGSVADQQWHSITICQAAGKRPFGASQLTVYIDGAERKTSALKYPTFTEPFAYCKIGAELNRANATSLTTDPASKLSIKANIKDALKSSVPGVFSLPAYLKSNNTDPNIQWTMIGMEEVMWGRSTVLSGQLGPVYVLEDSLTQAQVKQLHNLGSNTITATMTELSTELTEVSGKTVFLFSPRVWSNFICTNVSSAQVSTFDGHTLAKPHKTQEAKDVINSLGGIQVNTDSSLINTTQYLLLIG